MGRHGPHRLPAPDRHPPRHRVGRRDGRDDRPAAGDRARLPHRRRRVPVGALRRGLRPAGPAGARRHARRRRRARGGRRRGQARLGRLRPVEAGQAGRAVVAVAVGRRAAGLAQRVRRDEPGHPRRGLRPARRRARPQVPAPRERARPGGRPRPALRRALDAPRLRRRPLGREDVQVARQLREPARLHRAARPAGVPADAAAGALPLAGVDGRRAGVGGGAHARRAGRVRPALGVGGGGRG